MTANGPAPQNYTFRYATSDRREAVEIRFQQRMVQDIIINPPSHPSARSVPITAADLQNVVDPLSALVLLSQARAQPSEQRRRLQQAPADFRWQTPLRSGAVSQGNALDQRRGQAARDGLCLPGDLCSDRRAQGRQGRLRLGELRHRDLACPDAGSGVISTLLRASADTRGNGLHGFGQIRCRDVCWASRARRLNEGNQSRQFGRRAEADGPPFQGRAV